MKSYNNLFEICADPELMPMYVEDAAKEKHKRRNVQKRCANMETTCKTVRACILDPDWVPSSGQNADIVDGSNGKARTIIKPRFYPDQIMHHAAVEPLKRIITHSIYEHVYGCLPPRIIMDANGKKHTKRLGPHAAICQMKKWAHGSKKLYVAELDVHHAYQGVNMGILWQKLKRIIRDKQYLAFIRKFLEQMTDGLPLGFYLSPWLFNFYLMDFDHHVKMLGSPHYLRYADNLFIFDPNKRRLRRTVAAVAAWLKSNLGLTLNGSKQIYRFEHIVGYDADGEPICRGRAINALGAVIHCNRTTLRKAILHRAAVKARRIHAKARATWHDAASMLARLSWFRFAQCNRYYKQYIKPLVNTRQLKEKVRRHNRAVLKGAILT